jgi:glycosyltransferase involved in cell wall biosynthesis
MSVFTKQIIKKLIKNNNYKYIFVSGNELDREILQLILNSKSIYKQINAPLPIFDQIILPYLIKKYNPDVCWFPSNTFPVIRIKKAKYVATIHDLIFFMDEFKVKSLYQKIAKLYRILNILIGVNNLQKITSVSKSTLKDIYSRFNIKKKFSDKQVLYNSLPVIIGGDDNVFKKYNLSSSDIYLYSIVGIGKHKNLNFLIESFNRLLEYKPNYKIVISGVFKSKYNGRYNNVIFTPFISEKEKISLLRNAKLFIFPSLVEGFGIPLLEGLFYNSKVLVSDIPVFREIGKKYVKYFDPYDKDFLIKYFCNNTFKINHEEAKNYILKEFNVTKTVKKLENIFHECR